MKQNKRLSYEEKLKICESYEKGAGSHRGLAQQYDCTKSYVRDLIFKYKYFGAEALSMQKRNKGYTKLFKNSVVDAYRNDEGSYSELAQKYGISNPALIASWVLGYNNIKTTYSGSGGLNIMGRKTTYDERIKIIDYLIKNELDYNKTAIHFNVSYQQVYTWYKKYRVFGVESLTDKRGRKKKFEELTELEQLRRENERLKKELTLSEAAQEVFKKKQELEIRARLTRLEAKKRMKQ